MQAVYILVALMAVAASALPEAPLLRPFIPLVSRTEVHKPNGAFDLRYETGEGFIFTERGVLEPTLDRKDEVLTKTGEYSFTAPDGRLYRTIYTAGPNGFQAVGDHLPKNVVPIAATF